MEMVAQSSRNARVNEKQTKKEGNVRHRTTRETATSADRQRVPSTISNGGLLTCFCKLYANEVIQNGKADEEGVGGGATLPGL